LLANAAKTPDKVSDDELDMIIKESSASVPDKSMHVPTSKGGKGE
jgi:hypothetical protein